MLNLKHRALSVFVLGLTSLISVAAHAADKGLLEALKERNPKILKEVSAKALTKAAAYYDEHSDEFRNKDYVTVIDFDMSSRTRRMHIINMRDGSVEHQLVAHGRFSGDDIAVHFSNREESKMSSLGAYKTGATYTDGEHPIALKLEGLEATNSHASHRKIVMHRGVVERTGEVYVNDFVAAHQARLGRSEGCPALDPAVTERIVKLLDGGSFLYIYSSLGQHD
jgi:hypothetical protein